ncbi:MAG: hypothetical protein VB137_13015 [Burkholderia sp.]
MRFTPNLCLEKPEPTQQPQKPQKPPNAHDGRMTTDRPNEGCSTTLKKFVLPPSRSRNNTIANGVSKNWASRHPSKPVRQRSCHWPPDRKIVSKQPDPVHDAGRQPARQLQSRALQSKYAPQR